MIGSTKKALVILSIMLLVIISNFFVPVLFKDYKYLLFLLGCGIVIFFTIGIDIRKSPNERKIIKNIVIYLLFYFLISYLFGLFIGFNKTIYSLTLSNLVKNILPTVTIIFVTEILRYELIRKTNNNKIVIGLSFVVFLLLDICIGFYNYNLKIQEQAYEFIGVVVLGGLSRNILMTVIASKVDYYTAITYRLIMELYIFIVPIVPAIGPYINSVILIVLPILLSFMILNTLRSTKIQKPNEKNKKAYLYWVVLSILLILVGINSGFFKYQSLVIGSNSMLPYMARGDVIVIEKLKGQEIRNLEKGDILVFRYDNKIIAHRIYEVNEKSNGIYFVTKGDNNNQPDDAVVSEEKVMGILRLRYKKIGLPSIWVSELFR